MMSRPEWLRAGALVKGIGFVGRVVQVVEKGDAVWVTLESAKAVRLHQKWDVLDYCQAPFLWEPATQADLEQDVAAEEQRLLHTLTEMKRWAESAQTTAA
jgi:hypothetical protein